MITIQKIPLLAGHLKRPGRGMLSFGQEPPALLIHPGSIFAGDVS